MTIGRGIRCAAVRAPNKPALILGKSKLSYRDLVRRMAQVANMARDEFALKPGDRAAIIAPNCLPFVEVVAGLSDVGVIVATLSPKLSPNELMDILDDCTPRLIIVHPDCAGLVQSAGDCGAKVLSLGAPYEALLAAAPDTATLPFMDETEPFALAYTSGTTGRPKGVLLSHRSRAITFMAMAAEYQCFGPDDCFLALAPMCHGAGFVFACASLYFGGTTVLFEKADPEAILTRIGQRDISGVFMVPTHFARIFELPQAKLAAYRDHALKTIISNAAALPQIMKERAVSHFGEGLLHETYGSTEGGIVTNIRPADLLRKTGSVGHPFPMTAVELRRADGSIAGPGEPGELFCSGPASFNGYWQRPDETAATLVDGWVTVGDVAMADEDGFITIVDRKKDMVVTGGMNVYPREVENVIARLPGVRDVAVIGKPSAEWGESLHAFIVRSSGAQLNSENIIAGCRDRLASFKIPRDVSFIDELPRNAGGKVLKTVLREKHLP